MRVRYLVLGCALVLAGLLAAAGVAAAQNVPAVKWGRCPGNWKLPRGWVCALYPVPLDYAHPQAGTIKLAVAKLPASSPGKRRGSVFFNPGGPGGGGLELARAWEGYVGPSISRVYDLVTWDPRGVIQSEPALLCLSLKEAERAKSARVAVLTDREILARLKATSRTATGCARKRQTRFVTTVDNVRDLDRLRAAVRDPKLSYVGISYGTVIGAVYANMFPDRYRALVLHGVVDSVTWFEPSFRFMIDDAIELQRDLQAALKACDAAPKLCVFAPNAPRKYARLLAVVRARSTASGNSKPFTGLYDISRSLVTGRDASSAAADLRDAYREMVKAHDRTSPQLTIAANGAQPSDTWSPLTDANSDDVRDATICSDAGQIPTGWIHAARAADRVAPVFGVASVLDRSMCAAWSAFGARYTGGWGAGRAPILVLNQQWDHATPLAWARTMTRELHRAHLITISGWGHGVETPCSTRAVDSYLLTGRTPPTTFCGDGRRLFRRR